MTQPQNVGGAEASASAHAALMTSIEAARETILHEESLRNAFLDVSRAAKTLRDAADEFSHLRAVIVSKIHDEEHLSLSKLADVIGVSKARAGQLTEAGHKVRAAEDPDH